MTSKYVVSTFALLTLLMPAAGAGTDQIKETSAAGSATWGPSTGLLGNLHLAGLAPGQPSRLSSS